MSLLFQVKENEIEIIQQNAGSSTNSRELRTENFEMDNR
jgi:hypothetical protein